jgi:PAS domain S-box-containing protein
MFLFWGPESICFYNDAYRLSLGNDGKHPSMLGQPGDRAFPEAWPIIHPLIVQVLAGGEATWSEDRLIPIYRNGSIEDVYWTFSYSPVNDESGHPAGVFVTCAETTDKVNTLKRLEESNRRYFNNIMQSPVAMCVFQGKDHIVETVNDLMLELWGKEAWQVIDKPIFEGLPEAKGQGLEALLDSVYATGERFTANERPVDLPRHGKIERTYITFVYEAMREPDGTISGIVATANDVTAEVTARHRVEEINDRLTFAIDAGEMGTFDYNPVTNKFTANDRLKDWFGLEHDTEIDLSHALAAIDDKDRNRVMQAITASLDYTGGGRYDTEFLIIHPVTKAERIVRAKGKATFGDDQKAIRLNGTLHDITREEYAKQDLAASRKNLEMAIEIGELGTYSVDLISDQATYSQKIMDWFGTDDPHMPIREMLSRILPDDFDRIDSAIDRSLMGIDGGSQDFVYRVVNPRDHLLRYLHATGRVVFENGVAVSVSGLIQDITKDEIAKQALAESRKNLQLAIEIGELGTYSVNFITGLTTFSQHIMDWFGFDDPHLPMTDIVPMIMPEDQTLVRESMARSMADESSAKHDFTYRVIHPIDGTLRYLHSSGQVFFENGKPTVLSGLIENVTERILAQQTLEENEQKFRSLVLSAPFALALYVGEEMRIELANQTIIDIWGKGNDVIGKLFTDVLPELKGQKVFEQILDVFHTGESFHIQNQPLDLVVDGKRGTYYFNYNFTPIFDAEGKVFAVMNTGVDLTDLNVAKKKIEESEERFRSNVKQAPLGITIFRGPDFIVELANETYLLLVDRKESEFVGRPLFDSLPEVEEVVRPLLTGVFTTGEPFYATDFPVTLHRYGRDELTYFNLAYQPLREQDGTVSGIMVVATEVTKSVEAKLLLEESEKRFRNLVMSSSVPMAVLRGHDFVIEMSNAAMCETIWSKKPEDVLGYKMLDIFPELESQRYPDMLRRVLNEGITLKGSESIVDLSGDEGLRRLYVDFEYSPLTDKDGTTTGIMVTANDVTAKVEARQKVENAEITLRLAAEATELATWELDLVEGGMIHSPRLPEIFGRDRSSRVSHATVRGHVHPEDIHEIVERAYDLAMETGIYKYTARIVKPDGEIGWIDTRGKVVYDKDNKPVKLIGTVRDITEERYHQQQLEEREQKFRLLADSMPQMIWTGDAEGHLNYFNRSVYEYGRLSPEEIDGGGWLQIVHPDDREENMRVWMESVTTGRDFLFEHRFRRYDGEYRWQLSRAIPQLGPDDTIQMWVGTSTDIHDQKAFTSELERQVTERTSELEQKNKELENINAELKSFVYISSHDLQEPLRKIQTFAGRLAETESSTLSDNAMNYLGKMQNSATRMRRLIEDLLAYSRLSVTEQVFENIEISDIILDVKEELKENLQDKRANIVIEDSCKLKVIPFQFHQLFFNLISNSLKFSVPDRDPDIHIRCEAVKGDKVINHKLVDGRDYCHIVYRDNGIGFDPGFSEKIFEVFQRLHPKEKYEGTGIGLAIVRKVVENHNGLISATGVVDRGATFDIYIPF